MPEINGLFNYDTVAIVTEVDKELDPEIENFIQGICDKIGIKGLRNGDHNERNI